jgi:16S rRNA (guanine527-N7)-methyltransferase
LHSRPALLERAESEILRGAYELGLKLSSSHVESYLSYISLLVFWNERVNLTGAKDPLTVVRRHILDSLAISRFLSPDLRLVDAGSGAGFPGLVVKILYRSKPVSLVEARRKRANFLREAVRTLRLAAVEIVEERIELFSIARPRQFHEATARAFGSPEVLFPSCYELLADQGTLFIMQGPKREREFSFYERQARSAGFDAARIETYRLPLSGERRVLFRFSKSST